MAAFSTVQSLAAYKERLLSSTLLLPLMFTLVTVVVALVGPANQRLVKEELQVLHTAINDGCCRLLFSLSLLLMLVLLLLLLLLLAAASVCC